MKLTHAEVKNFLGIQRLSLELPKPITLIAGPNGAGKSSLQNAIRMALTGAPSRVNLKKHYGQLITKGQKRASVSVGSSKGDTYGFDLPKGASPTSDNEFLPFVLEPAAFARLEPKERRTLLYKLTGANTSGNAVAELVKARGCNMQLFESIKPLLRSGFPEAEKQCKENARDEKANWKAVTGETWGADKAEGWEPEPVEFDAELLEEKLGQFDKVDERFGALNRELGSMQQRQKNRVTAMEEKQRLSDEAEDINRKKIAMESAEKRLQEQKKRVEQYEQLAGEKPQNILACPCCGGAVVMVDGELVEYAGSEPDPEARGKLEQHRAALTTCENTYKNTADAYNKAHQALEKWKLLEVPETIITDEDFKQLQDDINLTRNMKNELQLEIEALNTDKDKAANVQRAINQAAKTHKAILDWLKLAEELGPEGIPAELLSKLLDPVNQRMAQSSADTGWKQPQIDAAMEITAGFDSRPYHLLSESEQWRVDAILAETISFISGLKLLCLDRFDVNQPSERGYLFQWLTVLAQEGEIDTVLVFGTLKKCPSSTEFMDTHWIEGGELITENKTENAA